MKKTISCGESKSNFTEKTKDFFMTLLCIVVGIALIAGTITLLVLVVFPLSSKLTVSMAWMGAIYLGLIILFINIEMKKKNVRHNVFIRIIIYLVTVALVSAAFYGVSCIDLNKNSHENKVEYSPSSSDTNSSSSYSSGGSSSYNNYSNDYNYDAGNYSSGYSSSYDKYTNDYDYDKGYGYTAPKEGESFSDYVKRQDPELYESMTEIYNSLD